MRLSIEAQLRLATKSIKMSKGIFDTTGLGEIVKQANGEQKSATFEGVLELLEKYPESFKSYSRQSKRFLFSFGLFKIIA